MRFLIAAVLILSCATANAEDPKQIYVGHSNTIGGALHITQARATKHHLVVYRIN